MPSGDKAPVSPAEFWARIVQLLLIAVDGLILIRFLLELLAANPYAAFSMAMFRWTRPLVWPFLAIFPSPHAARHYFDTAAVVAMVVYYLVALLLMRAFRLGHKI